MMDPIVAVKDALDKALDVSRFSGVYTKVDVEIVYEYNGNTECSVEIEVRGMAQVSLEVTVDAYGYVFITEEDTARDDWEPMDSETLAAEIIYGLVEQNCKKD